MKKSVLLPYDRYQRLLSGMLENEASMSTSEQEHSPQHGAEDSAHVTENAIANNPEHQRASETLTQHFPRSMQNRLLNMLTYIQPHLSWNDKGEVMIEEKWIPGSNIVDLIKVHLKDYKNFEPVGKEAFSIFLLELNVPVTLLAPSARQQSGSGDFPPPPGLPLKRTHLEDSYKPKEKVKWLRL